MANHASSIYVDPRTKTVHFYSNASGTIVHDSKNYSSRDFDNEFYGAFIEIVREFMTKYTPAQSLNSTILLPDSAFFTDTVSFPALQGKSLESALENTLNGLFAHRKEIRLSKRLAVSNKQVVTYCIVGLREELISNFKSSCMTARVVAQNYTFPAATTAMAIGALNPKLAKSTYLLFDVKEDFTRIVYVFHGETVAFSELPFGYSILDRNKVMAEDMLFDHSTAELAVLNARERAKAKALTVMDSAANVTEEEENPEDTATEIGKNPEKKPEDEDEENDHPFGAEEQTAAKVDYAIKVLPKKQPRKLPKFMQRPVPEEEEGFVAENFRIFEKWALGFLEGNDRLLNLGKPEAVYFNLPDEYSEIFERVNAEEAENGIRFSPIPLETRDDSIRRNLELYGTLFVSGAKGLLKKKPSNIL